LNKALKIDPNDKGIVVELKKIRQKEEENRQREKNLYGKMFGGKS